MPSNVSVTGDDALTLDMVKQFTFCPRLFHLMYVEGRWADNAYTIEGRNVHRRVDQLDHVLPDAEAGGGPAIDADDAGDAPDAEDKTTTTPGGKRKSKRAAPADDGDEPPVISRSVPLSSSRLRLTAKLDLVATVAATSSSPEAASTQAACEASPTSSNDTTTAVNTGMTQSAEGLTEPCDAGSRMPAAVAAQTASAEAVPVETKRGRVPNNAERCYDTQRVQLMAQGLLLREAGYRCDHGFLYFAGSRTRVRVPFTSNLEAQTLALIEQTHQAAGLKEMPPPLDDSPKCKGCSLNGICLPDETLALQQVPADQAAPTVRRLYPARDDAQPLYVQEQGAFVGKTSQRLVVRKEKEELSTVGLKDVSQLVLCGNVGISAQTIHLLCEAGIPVVHLSMGHWFYGVTHGITLRNAFDRAAQFQAAARPDRCLAFAKQLVADKVANQRTLLRRNAASSSDLDRALRDMEDLQPRIAAVDSLGSLLGLEGAAAAHYFARFADMLKPRDFDATWDFNSRNRRPPRDPVNAMLSFAYALLVKECTVALLAEGLDPWWGFYHQPRHGRPALALDLMEPFRPTVADSVVITAINTGMVASRDFHCSAAGCMLQGAGRKAVLRAYEARLDQLVTHPKFDYRCSWRTVIKLQARLLARWLRGDVPTFENIVTR